MIALLQKKLETPAALGCDLSLSIISSGG